MPASPAAIALPQNAVLANNFVGGSGASARLDDLLERGVMVDGHRVQLAAFTERDALPYARPGTEAVALHAEVERPRIVSNGDTVHLAIALMAREGELPRRPRMDIRLVIDRSGSMAGEKFTHAMNAAHQLVRHLAPGDRLGIIGYDSTADVVLSSGTVGDGRRAHAALDRMVAGGGTNIDAGLSLAEADPPRRDRPSDLGLVVLVSDGQATDGNGAPSYLGGIARRMYDAHGVLTTTIGLGTDFDENTMLTIAREGSGSYHFVRRPADITAILSDELEDRAQAVAQALRVRIVLGPGVTARKVYGSRALSSEEHQAVRRTEIATDVRIAEELGIAANREDEETGLRMHLPTFRRGDQHVILLELDVPGGRVGSTAGVARVELDYKDLYREMNGEAEVNVVARRVTDRQTAVASTERTVKRTVLAFQAGEALQLAAEALGRGDRSDAQQILTERHEVLVAGAELWRDPLLARDAELLAQYQRVVDGAWDHFGYGDQRTLVMAMGSFADRRMR
jgi:Ca-activated chloride channel family protein